MALLVALYSAVATGGSGDAVYNAAQSIGTVGGIYIVVFIMRKLRARDWD